MCGHASTLCAYPREEQVEMSVKPRMPCSSGQLSVMSHALIVRTFAQPFLHAHTGKKGPYGGVTAALNAPATAAEKAGQALYITVDFVRLEISLVDQKPEEVLAATLVGLKLESASGIGPDGSFSSLRFSLNGIQLDDMLPTTR